jgi:hypothetical protein
MVKNIHGKKQRRARQTQLDSQFRAHEDRRFVFDFCADTILRRPGLVDKLWKGEDTI